MNGVSCGSIVSLMARIAIRTEPGIASCSVTIITGRNRMALREREEAVNESCAIPAQGIDRVACSAVLGKAGLSMCRISRCLVITAMTIYAVNP
jgi:hypothetical protein